MVAHVSDRDATPEGTSGARRLAAYLRDIVDHLTSAVIVYDLQSVVLDSNARLLELFGIGPEGAAAFGVHEDSPSGDHPLEPLQKHWHRLRTGGSVVFECRLRNVKTGSLFDVKCVARRVTLAGEESVLADLHDVTAQNRSSWAVLESKKQLEQAILVRTRELQKKMRLIEEQQRELLELSTPVVQVWDSVLVLPLIGTIDSARSSKIMESLLSRIVSTASRQVIIDITGVVSMDEQVSGYLLKTAQAARLLGAECSLVGISPIIAQSLVHIGVEWSSVRTFSNLQAGLQHAILRLSKAHAQEMDGGAY